MLHDDELALHIDTKTWRAPPIFELIASAGVDVAEMRTTFNMGIGMVVAVAAGDVEHARTALTASGETVFFIGDVRERGDGPAVVFDS